MLAFLGGVPLLDGQAIHNLRFLMVCYAAGCTKEVASPAEQLLEDATCLTHRK